MLESNEKFSIAVYEKEYSNMMKLFCETSEKVGKDMNNFVKH